MVGGLWLIDINHKPLTTKREPLAITKVMAMKLKSMLLVLTAGAIAFSCSANPSNQPKNTNITTFVCGTDSAGTPTTYAQTPRGQVAVIKWYSRYFKEAGFTPEERCRQVSSQFQKLYNEGSLNFLSAGRKNNQPVICALKEKNSECEQLFTLKSSDDASSILSKLRQVKQGTSRPIYAASNTIDLNEYLKEAAVEELPSGSSEPSSSNQPSTKPAGNPAW